MSYKSKVKIKRLKRRNNLVTNEFAEASAELIEILKYLPETEVEKIPLKLRKFFKQVANPNCKGRIDPYKTIEQQNIKEKTRDLIAVIYRNYWCTEEERITLDKKLKENDKKYQEELREKYNPDNIFRNKPIKEEAIDKNTELVEYKEQKWYQTLIKKLLKIFKK